MADDFTFGTALTTGVNNGLVLGQNAKEFKLKQQAAAEKAITDKYTRIDKSVDDAWKIVANKDLPDSVRLAHYNAVIVPGETLLSGYDLPKLDKFPDWGNEFGQKYVKIKEQEKAGTISREVARASYSALMADYASKVPEPVMSKIKDLSFPTSTVENIPGPDGTTTTRSVNQYGESGDILGQGTPKPDAGKSANDLRSKAIDDIRDAIRIKSQIKSSALADLGGWVSKKTGGAPSDKEQAMNQVNVNIALRARDLGLTDEQTHKLIAGTIQLDDLAKGEAPAAVEKSVPKGKPTPGLLEFATEAEARKAGKGKGDRVKIGGRSGTLQ